VGAGLICIFIEPHILNEARVPSYSQDILTREEISRIDDITDYFKRTIVFSV